MLTIKIWLRYAIFYMVLFVWIMTFTSAFGFLAWKCDDKRFQHSRLKRSDISPFWFPPWPPPTNHLFGYDMFYWQKAPLNIFKIKKWVCFSRQERCFESSWKMVLFLIYKKCWWIYVKLFSQLVFILDI